MTEALDEQFGAKRDEREAGSRISPYAICWGGSLERYPEGRSFDIGGQYPGDRHRFTDGPVQAM